jgi:hypothetical protein
MRRDSVLRRLLALADVVAAAVAISLALALVGQDAPAPAAILALPLLVLIGKVVGLYDRDERLLNKTTLSEGSALFQVATLYTLLILVAEPLLVRETWTGDRRLRSGPCCSWHWSRRAGSRARWRSGCCVPSAASCSETPPTPRD